MGVTGCIAAYKAASVASALTKRGAEVTTIMTAAARKFVTPLTFRTLTGRPVITDLFDERAVGEPAHVSVAEAADVIVIAPATADIIGKLASGICDDMLTCTVTAADAPVIIAPAMNDRMYKKRVVQQNIRKLKRWGVSFVGPEKGRLASGKIGVGRMSEPDKVVAAIEKAFSGR